jgi:hypothetical protein
MFNKKVKRMSLDIDLPIEFLNDICTSGNNDCAVDYWYNELIKQLNEKECREVVNSSIPDTPEDQSAENIKKYALWITAWDQFDSQSEL